MMRKFDLHVHTTASPDGMSTPKALIRAALKKGLQGIAVTDHNTNRMLEAVRLSAPEGFTVIAGVEYSTDCGHILALFCEDLATGVPKDERGRYLLASLAPFVKTRGGILIAAHPFQRHDPLPEKMLFQYVDALEGVNARALSRDPLSSERVEKLAKKAMESEEWVIRADHRADPDFSRQWVMGVTAGSDAHLPMEIGRAYTEIPQGMDIKEAILNALCKAKGKPGHAVYRIISRGWRRFRLP